jgi:hypothetical protein
MLLKRLPVRQGTLFKRAAEQKRTEEKKQYWNKGAHASARLEAVP